MKQENENRKLPVIDILPGATFYVDAVKQLLIDTENPNNTISPMEMLSLEDHSEFVFDKQTRNLKPGNWMETDNHRYVLVWLRPLEVYDIEGAKIRDVQEGSLIQKNLPEINIEGVKFLWDRQHTLLLQKDNPYNQIHKSTMDMRGGIMGIYFDKHKKIVPFPHEINSRQPDEKLPLHIRFVPSSEINQKIRLAEAKLKHPTPKRKGMQI